MSRVIAVNKKDFPSQRVRLNESCCKFFFFFKRADTSKFDYLEWHTWHAAAVNELKRHLGHRCFAQRKRQGSISPDMNSLNFRFRGCCPLCSLVCAHKQNTELPSSVDVIQLLVY